MCGADVNISGVGGKCVGKGSSSKFGYFFIFFVLGFSGFLLVSLGPRFTAFFRFFIPDVLISFALGPFKRLPYAKARERRTATFIHYSWKCLFNVDLCVNGPGGILPTSLSRYIIIFYLV